jgi:hypothetical protein
VQARLVKYVRAKVQANPHNMRKRGRPLLDYALRSRRVTPIHIPYHSMREDPSLDVDMVELLLSNGADPYQPIYERGSGGASSTYQSLNKAWYRACRAMIRAGACADCRSNSGRGYLNASSILNRVFGRDRAEGTGARVGAENE